MANTTKPKTVLKVEGIQNMLDNKRARATALFCYRPFFSYYYFKGQIISVADFNKMFPLDLKPVRKKGGNFDKTKNFIFNEKSY